MNKLSIIHKGIVVLLICLLLGGAILKKVLTPSIKLKSELEKVDSELIQKRIKLSMIDNLNNADYTIKAYSDIQSFIMASINTNPNVNITKFSEVERVKDSNYIDYNFTISGTQSELIIWLDKFEGEFNDAIIRSCKFESRRNTNDLFLTIYLRSVENEL